MSQVEKDLKNKSCIPLTDPFTGSQWEPLKKVVYLKDALEALKLGRKDSFQKGEAEERRKNGIW